MKALFISDKFNLASYVELELREDVLGIFVKRNYFIIKTDVLCTDAEFEDLQHYLYKVAKHTAESEVWVNTSMSFKIIVKYDAVIYDNLLLRFEILKENYIGSIHVDIGADYLLECLTKEVSCLINHDNLVFLEEKWNKASISLTFLGKQKYDTCLNFDYQLSIISSTFIIDKKISILDEDRLDICGGLKKLISEGTPYTIKLPDTFDVFAIKPLDANNCLIEGGYVADSDWEQNDIQFKKIIVSAKAVESLLQSVSYE